MYPRSGDGVSPLLRHLVQSSLIVALLAAVPVSPSAAGDSFGARTLEFDVQEAADGSATLLWKGELRNDSVRAVTLCGVVQLLDARERVVAEFETAAVNVKRFGTEEREEVFAVPAEVWARTDALEQMARLSTADPVNGDRIRSVELFTTSWCGYCRKAKAYLTSRGVEYVEYDVEDDPAANQRRRQLDGSGGVPLALIDGHLVKGFSEKTYAEVLTRPPKGR